MPPLFTHTGPLGPEICAVAVKLPSPFWGVVFSGFETMALAFMGKVVADLVLVLLTALNAVAKLTGFVVERVH